MQKQDEIISLTRVEVVIGASSKIGGMKTSFFFLFFFPLKIRKIRIKELRKEIQKASRNNAYIGVGSCAIKRIHCATGSSKPGIFQIYCLWMLYWVLICLLF